MIGGHKKLASNPMNHDVELHLRNLRRAPRCGAKTRAGSPCECPAIHGRTRCRLHGGRVPALRVAQKRKFQDRKLDCRRHRRAPMAAISRSVVCQQRHSGMTHRPNNSPAPVAGQRRLPPVRVKVWGADGKLAKVHPPDGEAKNWWRRLNKALGTMSSDFVNASLFQIQAAARSPLGGISELP